ncbi:porin [Idiomarina xiamenensis]|uniref:Porin n=1 Tax=Idiomarina xiamenensis 10-D-4 TaxID=740709 RepID=K2JW51_9GAMM|nr:porin [Idiomarina xiamenensis]EKE87616.1 porin [Idiomarina xiamenensis 10-D-4]
MNAISSSAKLSLAMLATLSFPSLGSELLDVYGRVDVSLQRNDDGVSSDSEMVSNSSRFGVKGSQALEHELEVFYRLEWQVDVADLGGDDNITSRNQYIGLGGAFGQVMLGRRDTVLKDLQGTIDQFSDYEMDIKALWEGENRTSDTLTYYSPKWQQWRVGLSYILSEEDETDDGLSLSLAYGDEYLRDTAWYAGVAVDRDVDGYDVVRAALSTKWSNTVLGLMYQAQELSDGGDKADGFVVSAAQPFGQLTLKLQAQLMDYDEQDGTDTSWAAGVDYRLGDNTKVYAWYGLRDLETSNLDQDYIAVGIRHNF